MTKLIEPGAAPPHVTCSGLAAAPACSRGIAHQAHPLNVAARTCSTIICDSKSQIGPARRLWLTARERSMEDALPLSGPDRKLELRISALHVALANMASAAPPLDTLLRGDATLLRPSRGTSCMCVYDLRANDDDGSAPSAVTIGAALQLDVLLPGGAEPATALACTASSMRCTLGIAVGRDAGTVAPDAAPLVAEPAQEPATGESLGSITNGGAMVGSVLRLFGGGMRRLFSVRDSRDARPNVGATTPRPAHAASLGSGLPPRGGTLPSARLLLPLATPLPFVINSSGSTPASQSDSRSSWRVGTTLELNMPISAKCCGA